MNESDKKPKLHSNDKALLKAAASGEGLVTLTPEDLEGIFDNIGDIFDRCEKRYPKLVEGCPYETRLAITAWVMKHIVDHAIEGGTYRHLIYNRLGFNTDAYVPLCHDGMTISNEFSLDNSDERYRP